MKMIQMTAPLYDYMLRYSAKEPPVLRQLRDETARHRLAGMQIPPEQGAFMAQLVKACGVRRVLEVGVFTGYSALAVALALPEDGSITNTDRLTLNCLVSGLSETIWN